LGFQFEGVQEAHFIVKGRSRDTAWFRILQDEWPAVERMLAHKLYAE
jgi:RimJ/RimL family protein N-acetyltransferase